jgi:hypothetical protein
LKTGNSIMATKTPTAAPGTANTEGETISAMTTEDDALTSDERVSLTQLEKTIQAGQQAFFEVGAALKEIRDSRFYRDEFKTFEEYCQKRLGFGRHLANRQIAAVECRNELVPIGTMLPANESQCRSLTKLGAGDRQDAWRKVLDRAPENGDGEKQITAKLVADVVREVSGATGKGSANKTSKRAAKTHPAAPSGTSASPRPDEAQLSRLTKEEVLNGATLEELLEAVRAIEGDDKAKAQALMTLAKDLDPEVVTSLTPKEVTLTHDDDVRTKLTKTVSYTKLGDSYMP